MEQICPAINAWETVMGEQYEETRK